MLQKIINEHGCLSLKICMKCMDRMWMNVDCINRIMDIGTRMWMNDNEHCWLSGWPIIIMWTNRDEDMDGEKPCELM